jgi:hypothetical protein
MNRSCVVHSRHQMHTQGLRQAVHAGTAERAGCSLRRNPEDLPGRACMQKLRELGLHRRRHVDWHADAPTSVRRALQSQAGGGCYDQPDAGDRAEGVRVGACIRGGCDGCVETRDLVVAFVLRRGGPGTRPRRRASDQKSDLLSIHLPT